MAGMLAGLRAFDFFDSLFFARSGVLLGDVLWYSTGKKLESWFPHHRISSFVIQRVKKYLPDIERNPFHIIFLSKFLYMFEPFNPRCIVILLKFLSAISCASSLFRCSSGP